MTYNPSRNSKELRDFFVWGRGGVKKIIKCNSLICSLQLIISGTKLVSFKIII